MCSISYQQIEKCLWEATGLQSAEKQMACLFKALGDENRIKILRLLRGGERCACVLLDDLRITQPTLSHHMRILCDSRIVAGRRDGKWMHYSISPEGAAAAVKCLRELTDADTAGEDRPRGER